MFAVIWARINFTWFASAYDTDDWIYRLLVMVQMIGVVILALGLPALFESIDAGETIDNVAMVVGYIVMRIGVLAFWLRAANEDSARRRTCLTYAFTISFACVGVDHRGRLLSDRGERPGYGRASGGRNAVASPAHRRAPRPAGHHGPR